MGDDVADVVRRAGIDLIAFINSDQFASGLADFVAMYFPRLSASRDGEDLVVINRGDEAMFVRRDKRQGHRGWSSLAGAHTFRTAQHRPLLDVGGGVTCDPEGLMARLAAFNNRF